jgi:tellurite resistance protein
MPFNIRDAFQNITWESEDQPGLVAELGLWAAMSDGDIEDREITQVVEIIRQLPGQAGFTTTTARQILQRILDSISTENRAVARIKHVTAQLQTPDLRRLAYQLAVVCTAQDRMFTETESDFLEGLRESFGLDAAEAKRLIDEVIGAK